MNKRASISTFVFVMMVLVTCIYTVWSFSKQVDESGKELLDVSVGMESRVMQEKADIYLRLISEKAAVLAFNETLEYFSYYYIKDIKDNSKNIKLVKKFSNEEYLSYFSSVYAQKFKYALDEYSKEIIDEDLFNCISSSKFEFDGKNIAVSREPCVFKLDSSQVNLTYYLDISYKTNLDNLGLINLSLIGSA